MRDPWQILGIEPHAEPRQVRRAYARCLKRIDQETEAAAFEELRSAYERAREVAELRLRQADPRGSGEPPHGNGSVAHPTDHRSSPRDRRTSSLTEDDLRGILASGEADRTLVNEAPPSVPAASPLEIPVPSPANDQCTSQSTGQLIDRTDDQSVEQAFEQSVGPQGEPPPPEKSTGTPLEGAPPRLPSDDPDGPLEPEQRPETRQLSGRKHPTSQLATRTDDEVRLRNHQVLDAVLASLDPAEDPRARAAAKLLFDGLQIEAGLSLIEREQLEIDLGHLLLSFEVMPRDLFLTASTHFGWDEGDLCERLFGVAGLQLQRRALAWKQRDQWQRDAMWGSDQGAAILLGEYQPRRYRWLALRPRTLRSVRAAIDRLRIFPELEEYEVDPRIVTWWRQRLRHSLHLEISMPALLIHALLFLIAAAWLSVWSSDRRVEWTLWFTVPLLVGTWIATFIKVRGLLRRYLPELALEAWYRQGFGAAAAALLPIQVLTDLPTSVGTGLMIVLLAWAATLHLHSFPMFLARLLATAIAGTLTTLPFGDAEPPNPSVVVVLLGLIYLADWDEPPWLRRAFLIAASAPFALLLYSLRPAATVPWTAVEGLVLTFGVVLVTLAAVPRAPALAVSVAAVFSLVVHQSVTEHALLQPIFRHHPESAGTTVLLYATLLSMGAGRLVVGWLQSRAHRAPHAR